MGWDGWLDMNEKEMNGERNALSVAISVESPSCFPSSAVNDFSFSSSCLEDYARYIYSERVCECERVNERERE